MLPSPFHAMEVETNRHWLGVAGFHFRGRGGGVNRAPKNLGPGVPEKAHLIGTVNHSLWSWAPKAPKKKF